MSALQGLRVLDFTQMMTGPMATMLLADAGADVVKVEQPTGDPFRKSGETGIAGDGAFFLGVNRNKRGVVIDLKTPEGQAAARRMATEADVFVENFRPGFTDKMGIGYDDLVKLNPRLIYCSITGFGQTGPNANRPALDQVMQAYSGLMQVTGTRDSGPLKIGFPFSDLVTALFATIGILTALQSRERTGQGQRVDLSMLDASLFAHVPRDVYFSLTGKTPGRWGNEHWDIVPNNVYRCADGEDMMIITINDKFWKILCDAMGDPDFATDERYATKAARLANRDSLDARLGALFATRPIAEWEAVLRDGGAIYGPVRTWPEVFADPYTQAEMLTTLTHPSGETFEVINNPLRFSQTPTEIRTAPPTLGQHNDQLSMDSIWSPLAAN
ncbi:CoA transferase [Sphingomonas sp. TF3]|uniref:CaiB/BaiF CoA transferase family protein n=1 Tax=Sphingomonas sp. TF3 TaxID=2495580 RepID=UPI000F89A5D1|nr:CoA transferase [Sphingomonas sp. TF3]RUN76535.1 CoA transferase [Sphingomonas sp. TF3]